MRQTISHGECGTEWTGANRAHCGACHRTFNTDGGADQHRTGKFGTDRRCTDPAGLGFRLADGIWYQPAPVGGHPFKRS